MQDPELNKQASMAQYDEELANQQEELKKLEQEIEEGK